MRLDQLVNDVLSLLVGVIVVYPILLGLVGCIFLLVLVGLFYWDELSAQFRSGKLKKAPHEKALNKSDRYCRGSGNTLPLFVLSASLMASGCTWLGDIIDAIPRPSPSPTAIPTPAPSPTPEPTPEPTPTPEPSPSPTPAPSNQCRFPQGIPDAEFIGHAFKPTLHDVVNAATSSITGCEVGSRCVLDYGNPQTLLQAIVQELRDRGYCAGQHITGHSDEILVAPAGGCGWFWEAFHSAAGPNADGKVVVVWARIPSENCIGEACTKWGGGAYRGEWRIPSAYCTTWPGDPEPPPQKDCINPTPGPIARMEAKIHVVGANFLTLDATPLVGKIEGTGCSRDWDYCREIGFTDGRGYCPPRQEGNPERLKCDLAVTGGGVLWYWNDKLIQNEMDGADVHLSEGKWMLRVRRGIPGFAKVCPRISSGCPEECGYVEVGL